MSEICFESAVVLAQRLRDGLVSATEVMGAFLDRIESINPRVNAIVALRDRDELMAEAEVADERGVQGRLHGLPLAVKDLAHVKGIVTRQGSLSTPDTPSGHDSLFVSRLRQAGGIVVGKTNTPEYGAGSNTYNEVYGITRNPHNLDYTAGGSSGGAAAALASGMLPIADGSDLGGSLRNPAAYCGVVGLRPSVGRVPTVPESSGFINTLAVAGPMARSVQDLAFMLSVMAGPDPRDPTSLGDDPAVFGKRLTGSLDGIRVAWAGDLGLPWDPQSLSIPLEAMDRFEAAGSHVSHAAPDLSGAMDAFRTLRALIFRDLDRTVPQSEWSKMKDTVIWNAEQGFALSMPDVMDAEAIRTRIHLEMVSFFDHHDVLALPTTQVPPFPVEVEYPTSIGDTEMIDYIDWMASCCVITVTGCPAISIPAGFTSDGLPVGLQLVGPVGGERKLLDIAYGFEQATADLRRRPLVLPD